MKYILKTIILLGFIGVSMNVSAQKIAEVNTDTILSIMPEYKAALVKADSIGKAKQLKLQAMGAEFQKKYEEYQKNARSKTYDKNLLELDGQALERLQADLKKREQIMKQTLQKTEQQLMLPIISKLKKAINVVAKKNGYSYVATKGMLLVAPDSADITSKVIKYLKL